MEHAVNDMTSIAVRKPVVNKARKSVAGFKLPESDQVQTVGDAVAGQPSYQSLDISPLVLGRLAEQLLKQRQLLLVESKRGAIGLAVRRRKAHRPQ